MMTNCYLHFDSDFVTLTADGDTSRRMSRHGTVCYTPTESATWTCRRRQSTLPVRFTRVRYDTIN